MSKGDTWENELLLLVFNNTNAANIGDAGGLRGSVAAGTFDVALHTADPGEAGTGATNETAYTGYTRKPLNRAAGAGGFTVTGNSVKPAADLDFPICTASPGGAITHFSILKSGTNIIMYSGTVTPNITMAVNVIPRIASTGSSVTED